MSLFTELQEANVSAPGLGLRDFSCFSIFSIRSPVSMALELANTVAADMLAEYD